MIPNSNRKAVDCVVKFEQEWNCHKSELLKSVFSLFQTLQHSSVINNKNSEFMSYELSVKMKMLRFERLVGLGVSVPVITTYSSRCRNG